jgi:hypothetical protein
MLLEVTRRSFFLRCLYYGNNRKNLLELSRYAQILTRCGFHNSIKFFPLGRIFVKRFCLYLMNY